MFSFPVFICFCMLRCVSNCGPDLPPLASRCVLLTTPEFYLDCSEYICFFFRPASRNFLWFLAFWGLVRWVFFGLRTCGFSGWAFALRPAVHWPCNFLFTFLTPKISLSKCSKRGGFYALARHAQRRVFWACGGRKFSSKYFDIVCFSLTLFFPSRPA